MDDPDHEISYWRTRARRIYTSGKHGACAALRKIAIRTYSWFNWVYPLNL